MRKETEPRGPEKIRCVIIGAGGHAEVVLDILRHDRNIEVVGFIDNSPAAKTVDGLPILGGNSILPELMKKGVRHAIIAIGENFVRKKYSDCARGVGMKLINAVHPHSIVAPTALLGSGVVIAAGAVICSYAKIGDSAIVNTGSIIEHHVEIGHNSHVGPGVRIAGRTKIGDCSFVGIGATIIDNIKIGDNTVIGAGAVVTKDLPDDIVAVGIPAKIIRRRRKGEPVFKQKRADAREFRHHNI